MPSDAIEPPFNPDEAARHILEEADRRDRAELFDPPPPRCSLPGCKLPGRFVLGITEGAVTTWCVDHVHHGITYFTTLVDSIREIVDHARDRDHP